MEVGMLSGGSGINAWRRGRTSGEACVGRE